MPGAEDRVFDTHSTERAPSWNPSARVTSFHQLLVLLAGLFTGSPHYSLEHVRNKGIRRRSQLARFVCLRFPACHRWPLAIRPTARQVGKRVSRRLARRAINRSML